MGKGKVFAIAAAALVAGLVLGSLSLASAAPAASGAVTSAGVQRVVARGTMGLAGIVAKLTGMTLDQVRADRQSGKSLADIAKAKGVASDKVVGNALDIRKASLDQAVKQSLITQEQADQMLSNMKTRLDSRINSTATGRGCGGAGGAGCGGGGAGCGLGAGRGASY